MGISGQELSNGAFVQAEKFEAHIAIAQSAKGLKTSRPPYTVELDDGGSARGRTVIRCWILCASHRSEKSTSQTTSQRTEGTVKMAVRMEPTSGLEPVPSEFSVVVQFESSHLTIATEAWKPASLKAMPPQSNIM